MAKGILQAEIDKDSRLRSEITVDSAGIYACYGEPASFNSINVLKEEWSIDITAHQAKILDGDIASKSDIILTMTRSHRDAIINQFPNLKSKVFTLKEYVSDVNPNDSFGENHQALDISDPFGLPMDMYRLCAKEIKIGVDKLVVKLKNEFLRQ
jgi:protein-tyrosine-phosphatase